MRALAIALLLVVLPATGCRKCIRSHQEKVFVPMQYDDDGRNIPAHYEYYEVCDEYEQKENQSER